MENIYAIYKGVFLLKHTHTQYSNKLKDIQAAISLIEFDYLLLESISKEMAFQWVPAILLDMERFNEENIELHAEIIELNLQNDELLKQNIYLTTRLSQ